MKLTIKRLSAIAVAMLLAACGGSDTVPANQTASKSAMKSAALSADRSAVSLAAVSQLDWITLLNHCEHPRTGTQASGLPYTDVQGTLTDELKWLRSFIDQTYLWYSEVPTTLNMADYKTPLDYFAVLKTPLITASGRAKDRFHFTYPTATYDAMSTAGVELGYGFTWLINNTAPRVLTVTMVEPDSPADIAGFKRGDLLLSVDDVDVAVTTKAGVAALNAGLFPVGAGERHKFVLRRDKIWRQSTMTAKQVAAAPVRNVQLLSTETGNVGYLQFNEHNQVAEAQLVDAINTFKTAGITDLVLDMRYNGGGLLAIASELAYMIAGPDATTGKTFELLKANDKYAARTPQRFQASAIGYQPTLLTAGSALPYLGLKRVTVLTTSGTCSASESVINSLRGVDVEVTLIGGDTCGKPYAFVPAPNCGTTYFAIQLQGVNNKGFGDYADGFPATCSVADDLNHALGDPAEGVLAAALSYRATGACPAVALRDRSLAGSTGAMRLLRPDVKEISIIDR